MIQRIPLLLINLSTREDERTYSTGLQVLDIGIKKLRLLSCMYKLHV